jgi:HK97 family phage major capsid protein
MSAGSNPDGGFGVTPQLSAQIAKRLFDQSPLRQICRVVEVVVSVNESSASSISVVSSISARNGIGRP